MTFAGIVKFEEIDDANHTARVSAQGTDAKGRGGANAASVFRLEPAGTGSKVLVHTNLTLSGAVAQYGRGVGIIQATATQLMNQFAKCLKEKLAQEGAAAAPPRPPPAVRPVPSAVDRAATCPAPARQADLGLRVDGEGDLELDRRLVQAIVATRSAK